MVSSPTGADWRAGGSEGVALSHPQMRRPVLRAAGGPWSGGSRSLQPARPSQLSSATSSEATSLLAASEPTETMAAAGGSSPPPPGPATGLGTCPLSSWARQLRSPPLLLKLPRPCSVHPLPSSKVPFPKCNQLTTSFPSPCLLSPPSSSDRQVLKFLSPAPGHGLTSLSFPWRHPASPSKPALTQVTAS